MNLPHSERPKLLKNQLRWHWDYCAKSSIVLELYSDFEAGRLEFAPNKKKAPRPNSRKPASHYDAKPNLLKSFIYSYPEHGALIFPAKRGGLLHCPLRLRAESGMEGMQLRILMLVASKDTAWSD